jgi:hypothetical protein
LFWKIVVFPYPKEPEFLNGIFLCAFLSYFYIVSFIFFHIGFIDYLYKEKVVIALLYMKRILSFVFISTLFLIGCCFVSISCSKEKNESSGGSSYDGTTLNLITGGKSSCNIVYPYGSSECYSDAHALSNAIKSLTGLTLPVIPDSKAASDYEILVGKTSRPQSAGVLSSVGDDGFAVCITDRKVVITGTTDSFTALGLYYFETNILKNALNTGTGFLKMTSGDDHVDMTKQDMTMASMIKSGYSFTISTLLTGSCPAEGDINISQGACSDGTYAYIINRTSDDAEAIVYKYKLDGFKLVGRTERFSAGHCNDMTFDNDNGRIVIAHGQTEGTILTMVDASSMTVIGNVNIPKGSGAITYNAGKKEYAVSQGGKTLWIADTDFNILRSFTRTDNTGYTAQGMGSDDNYIYFPMSGTKDNILVVYDWNGNYVRTITVKNSMESESLFCVNGVYYINFYKSYHKGSELHRLSYSLLYNWTE